MPRWTEDDDEILLNGIRLNANENKWNNKVAQLFKHKTRKSVERRMHFI